PEHRDNILGDFSEMGAALAYAGDGRPYWCVDFAKPWPRLDPAKAASDMAAAINSERTKAGHSPLKVNEKIAQAAQRHARGRAQNDQRGVQKAGDQALLEQIAQEAGDYDQLFQLDARGAATPSEALKSWLKAESERKALLGDFTDVGVGY